MVNYVIRSTDYSEDLMEENKVLENGKVLDNKADGNKVLDENHVLDDNKVTEDKQIVEENKAPEENQGHGDIAPDDRKTLEEKNDDTADNIAGGKIEVSLDGSEEIIKNIELILINQGNQEEKEVAKQELHSFAERGEYVTDEDKEGDEEFEELAKFEDFDSLKEYLEQKYCKEKDDYWEPDSSVDPTNPETIPKFVDPLPIPVVAKPIKKCNGKNEDFYVITMKEGKHRFHKNFPLTTIFGYNGTYPGPTFNVQKDVPIKVKWENKLPRKHILPVDRTLHGTSDTPEVRTVVHLHGANVAADSDGHPEAWYSRNNEYTGHKYTREVYEYTNHQPAGALWYHDHAIGITRLNVYAGLAGFYFIRDFLEERLNLPKGPYEVPLLIQDKQFNQDGSLFYPDNATPPLDNPIPSTPSFFFGNTVCVNGKLWPYMEVEPRKYRFRILNESNTRPYELALSNGEMFHQIGTELGFLHESIEVPSFILEPAERIDVIVDFSKYKGQEIILQNIAQTPPSPGMEVIMKFKVTKALSCPDTSTIPKELMPFHKIDPALATKQRTMQLVETTDHYGRVMHLLNNKQWDAPATEKPKLDSVEIWHLVNNFNFAHPIHLHLVHFEILGRKEFTPDDFDEEGNYKFDPAKLTPPLPYENGRKDVVRAEPGQVTSIIMHFKEHTGDYVWHCHILEHEDNDMMRPLVVEK